MKHHFKVFYDVALLAFLSMGSVAVSAPLDRPLSPRIPRLVHPLKESWSPLRRVKKSDTAKVLEKMTPVKDQLYRGTCSIFSAIAMLEALAVIEKGLPLDTDLSEEWLQYVVNRNSQDEGSSTPANLAAIVTNGVPTETLMPYVGETWESLDQTPLTTQRCFELSSTALASCLMVHWNPLLLPMKNGVLQALKTKWNADQFLRAREDAFSFRDTHLRTARSSGFTLRRVEDVKTLLSKGIPVLLDLDFFYGAWNHRRAEKLGIGRDKNAFLRGEVGYPAPGSLDLKKSEDDPAGHSILVVGFDDSRSVKTQQKMEDGTTREITYRGVYYFKNSWGTDADTLGAKFQFDGKSYPGYGMITQDYAHDFGQFFQFSLKGSESR
jgi:hypothetical protein